MSIVRVDRVTLHRTQIADILAEGQRRIEGRDSTAPEAQQPGESAAAYALRLADFFIHLACIEAALDCFDGQIRLEHARQLVGA